MTRMPYTIMATLLAAAAAIVVPAAQACQITKTAWGLQVTDCNLSEFYKNRYNQPLHIMPNRPVLRMPNLQVADIDGTLVGSNSVTLSIEIENAGLLNVSTAFEVTVLAEVSSPTGGVLGTPLAPVATISIPGLAAGTTVSRAVASLTLPNRTQDWDVCGIATVDPALMGGSAWGSVFESNEMDNTKDRCCRVYGPNPNTNGPRQC